jgi:5-formyltetrahydrofolate cyclo-ligase
MVAEKAAFRTTLLAVRRATSPAVRAIATDRLLTFVAELLVTLRPAVVAGYVPVGTEPGGMAEAGEPGLPDLLGERALFPVLEPNLDLDWARGELGPSSGGLLEPTGARLGVDAIAKADLVIVPALAVDHAGMRLGRGGGSYDRALARVPRGVPIVALIYDNEFLPWLPSGAHDRSVTGVITPNGGFESLPRHLDWTKP